MDTEYILDCAFELAETTAVEHAILCSKKGAYWKVRETVDANLHMPDHFLQNTARSHLDQASLPEKYFFALCGLHGLQFSLKAFAERAAHLVQTKVQQDLGLDQPRRNGLFLELEAMQEAQEAKLVLRETDIGEGLVRQMLNQLSGPTAARWSEDLQLMAQAAVWYRADEGQAFERMLHANDLLQGMGPPCMSEIVRVAVAAQCAALKQLRSAELSIQAKAKAAIKKASKLFQNMGQEQNLKLFVSGSEVTLSHPQSKFKLILKPLQVSGWLIDRTTVGRTHTPYELSLYTKDDVYLAKLCVYFNSTPVLDQLLALTLFVESGEELKILEKANWFATGDWTDEKTRIVLEAYPQLTTKLPRKKVEGAEAGTILSRLRANDPFFQREAQWEPFKGRVEQWVATWMEPATQAAQQLSTSLKDVQQKILNAELARQQSEKAVRIEMLRQLKTIKPKAQANGYRLATAQLA